MSYLDLGLSAIRANQVALQTIGNNIANVGTEGYHRQEVRLADRLPQAVRGLNIGTGVDVARIERLVQQSLESSLVQNDSLQATAAARESSWRQIETVLLPGSGSLDAAASDLFAALEQLSGQPQESALGSQFLESASRLTREFNRVYAALDEIAKGLTIDVQTAVDDVNRLAGEVAPISQQIRNELALGRQPNDLLDRRQQLLTELAGLIDVDRLPTDQPGEVLTAGGGTFILSGNAEPLTVVRSSADGVELRLEDSQQLVQPTAGKLAGLLSSIADVRQMQSDLADWFDALRQQFDQIQATGLGATGPLSSAASTRTIATDSIPLDQLNLPGELQAGNLFVTVTDTATQQRTTQAVSIDPTNDTLADVIARLNTIPGVNAGWDAAAGRLTIFAGANRRIDFAGRLDQQPETTSVAGTATASLDGLYTGAANAHWRITVLDSGDVGATQPLRLEVRDADSGALLQTVDAGLGYPPGTTLDLGDGVQLRLTSGTLQAGDEWTIRPVAEPDETGFLAALGINSFFSGNAPGEYAVNPRLLQQAGSLALSRTGLPGEAGNLARWLQLRDEPLAALGDESLPDRMASLLSSIGLQVQAAGVEAEHLDALATQWRGERDSLSGVDVNEEMLSMLRFQQSYQSIAKFVASVNDTMQVLFGLVR